ncbi:MAG: hypothetical protein ACYST5_17015, partial [Planctomycetota bacterium]
MPNWTNVGDRGPDQATPDIAAIIQEIVNQDGWESGNTLVLIISDDPANPSTGIRCAEAGPGDDSALLVIEIATPVKFDFGIANDNDDVEEHGDWDAHAMESLTSSDLEMPYEDPGMGERQIIG